MSARVAHRGPDGEGLYLNHEQEVTADRPQVGLVHRRLAIIDPDPRANQPFTDGQGRWLVYNGEIYNFRELRAELKKLNPEYEWRTDCDTEVLLVAYGVWGEKCVEHLNGMFAFAVWDENAKTLYLARDRMGQKPLFLAARSSATGFQSVAFASELAPLRHLHWFSGEFNMVSVRRYLRWGYAGGLRTIYDQVVKLEPATTFTASSEQRLPYRTYFNPNPLEASVGNGVEAGRRSIQRAVQRQLVSDVPIGCFLSGGVDSSVIAACMKSASAEVQTFSVGFDDRRYDETQFAAAVARHLGTRHHELRVKPDAASDLPKLAEVFGEPFADSSALPTHYLARETRRHVKVALSGDGGDELFGGYDRYRAMRISERLRRVSGVSRLAKVLPAGHPKSRLSRAKRLLAGMDQPAERRYLQYLAVFDDPTIEDLTGEPLYGDAEVRAVMQKAGLSPPSVDGRNVLPPEAVYFLTFQMRRGPVEAALALDRVGYLPDDLLTKVDRASMLHALEVRSPFMDHELVQFAAGLTTDQLLKGGPKRMLREAFAQDLPAWVFKRKKMGFAVPIGEWFRAELRPMLRDHLFAADSFARGHFQMKTVERLVDEHETQRVDHSQRLYALLMLELWWKLQRAS
jgi:asparagine synthase (glutamine-hydrolysing)